MIWHIIKRELFDHINSLRFILTVVILSALMVTNAVVHLRTHPERVRNYSKNITESLDTLKSQTQLYALAEKGPGTLYKRPSSLAFIADGGNAYLPEHTSNEGNWSKSGPGWKVKSNWWLSYGSANPDAKDLRPQATQIDWVFIITYLLSFIPLLFTFDALSGEREQGTLRLCLANPISRPVLLIGKFLGTLITVLIPFIFAVLLNLTIISTDNWTQLNAADWGRLGLILLIASGYTGIFIGLGLMVSAGTREPRVSLVVLLLIWVATVIFMPSTLGTLSTKWMPPVQTTDQFHASRDAALQQIYTDYDDRLDAIKEKKNANANLLSLSELQKLLETSPEAARAEAEKSRAAWETEGDEEFALYAELVNRDVETRERFNREYLDAQIAQVQRVRVITRFSPAAIVQYALESMAGTGFNRHLQYLEHLHDYTKQFRQFIVETDRADNQSRHFIGIPEGMSEKSFSSEAIPKFEDKIAFSDTFNTATLDLLLLFLLLGVFFSGAFLIFVRSEV
ncbi:ABC transporter permease subunit [Candidatus Poribacteria bacterium]|nr:ABC transporter permease subunit [Candidatus Poribacteria bacterium]MYA99116.1 ABC transporter permease subunit [Candidatus Poribacteria bacterium]